MTDIRATLRARLDAAVGSAQVLTAESDVLPYVTDWRGRFHGRALAVVRPGSTDEVADVVRILPSCAFRSSRKAGTRDNAAARRLTPKATRSCCRSRG